MKTRIAFAVLTGLLLAGSTFAQLSTNSIVGVGLFLRASDQTINIQQVVPNSPAAKAGLKRGEVIEKIDGMPADGRKLKQCVDQIRGAEGTIVTLELVDPKQGTTNTVGLTREKIALPPMPHLPAHGP